MTLLSTLVPTLQRELAVPGEFESVFPNTSDDDLAAALADGFAEAQLRGFFPTLRLTVNASEDDWDTSEELSLGGGMLIVLFAGARAIRAQLRMLNTMESYKAGPTEFEIQRAASVLKDELAFINKRIDDLIKEADASRRAGVSARVHDGYLSRGGGVTQGLGQLFSYEYRA